MMIFILINIYVYSSEYGGLCDGVLIADKQQACDENLHYHSDRIER